MTREERIEYGKIYRSQHKEELALSWKTWYAKNKESVSKRHKVWREKNREKFMSYGKIDRKNNPTKYQNQWLRSKYNITLEEYFEMAESQNYTCPICKRHESMIGEQLLIDHDHKTGKVRGLLCRLCNQAIGMLKEDPATFNRALQYIIKNK